MPRINRLTEKEPLLQRKNSNTELKLFSDSSSSLELEAESKNITTLEILTIMARTIANALEEDEKTLPEDLMQAFSLLSITCKTMQAKLMPTERTSPLYYIEPKILLHKIKTLLDVKLNDNEKTLSIKTYLETHIAELKTSHWLGAQLKTSPPPKQGLWDHSAIKEFTLMLLLQPSALAILILDIMNKLPLTEELYNALLHARTNQDSDSHSEESKEGARLLTWLILYILYAGPIIPLSFALAAQPLKLLDVIWLKNAEHDLANITHYPEKALSEAVNQSESLNETINKEGAATTPETKYKTLTLFNQVSALKKIPAVPEMVDIEAQEEPQLRVNNR